MTTLLHSHQLPEAAALLASGKLVAFPTETVYGLGAPIFNEQAVRAIFTAKGRPSDNPLIAHVSDLSQISRIAIEPPPAFYRLAEAFFPGPLTLVLKRHPSVPGIVSAGLETIALRMPAHPLARALISLVGQPLVAPSANLSGKPSATDSQHVLEDFQGKIAAVLDGGKTEYGIESTVVSLLGEVPVILRPGAITRKQIEEVLGRGVLDGSESHEGPIVSPGMKYRHYAPNARVVVFENLEQLLSHAEGQKDAKLLVLSSRLIDERFFCIPLTAAGFYASLRFADTQGYDQVLIDGDEALRADEGLMNRVNRSANLI